MRFPIRIRTNTIKGFNYNIELYKDVDDFNISLEEKSYDDDKDVLFSGNLDDLEKRNAKVKEGMRVNFFIENQRRYSNGVVRTVISTPYYEIIEDKTNNVHYVHRKYVKTLQEDLSGLANLFIKKTGRGYRRYDIGVIKIRNKVFKTAEESLISFVSKGDFAILYKSKVI